MKDPREVKLPSGATLKVGVASFSEAKALYQALLKELKHVSIDLKLDSENLFKDIFCIGFSSPEIERCLWECMKKCQYVDSRGPLKIDKDTFEPESAREDYMTVCIEVAKENVLPFAKSLYAEFQRLSTMNLNAPA